MSDSCNIFVDTDILIFFFSSSFDKISKERRGQALVRENFFTSIIYNNTDSDINKKKSFARLKGRIRIRNCYIYEIRNYELKMFMKL